MTSSPAPVFVFRPQFAQAYGRSLPGGRFLICEGSTAMRSGSPLVKRDLPDRDALLLKGVLVPDSDPRLYRFTQDHVFGSSSKAAGIVKDGNASGPQLWKDEKTGRTLKDHLASRRKDFVEHLLAFPGGIEFERDETPLRDLDL